MLLPIGTELGARKEGRALLPSFHPKLDADKHDGSEFGDDLARGSVNGGSLMDFSDVYLDTI